MAEKKEKKATFKELVLKLQGGVGEVMPTGVINFDAILGGGVRKGQWVELFSESGLGKSTILLFSCLRWCEAGRQVLYLDAEHAVNDSQIDGIGLRSFIEAGKFILVNPVDWADVEDVLDSIEVEENRPDVVIFDSLTAFLVTSRKKDKSKVSILDTEIGRRAQIEANFANKYKSMARKLQVAMIFVSQMRMKSENRGPGITVFYEDSASGNAVKFYFDIRVRMKRSSQLVRNELVMGEKTEVPYGVIASAWAVKNRFARPFIPVNLAVIFGRGVSNAITLFETMKTLGLCEVRGSYFKFKVPGLEEKTFQGTQLALDFVKANIVVITGYMNKNNLLDLVQDKTLQLSQEEMDENS